jgi:hypothetical protein
LENRVERFNETIGTQKENKATEQRKLEDLSEELEVGVERQKKLVEEQARLNAEAAVIIVRISQPYTYIQSISQEQELRIQSREKAIQDISNAYNIHGLNVSLAERDRISEFLQRLDALQRKRRDDFENLRVYFETWTLVVW